MDRNRDLILPGGELNGIRSVFRNMSNSCAPGLLSGMARWREKRRRCRRGATVRVQFVESAAFWNANS